MIKEISLRRIFLAWDGKRIGHWIIFTEICTLVVIPHGCNKNTFSSLRSAQTRYEAMDYEIVVWKPQTIMTMSQDISCEHVLQLPYVVPLEQNTS